MMTANEKTTNSVGFTGVITHMASFNKELDTSSKVPSNRCTPDGLYYATHVKMKWLIRNYYARAIGLDSVFVKGSTYLDDKGAIATRTLEQRVKQLFNLTDKELKKLSTEELVCLVLGKQDVKNFGITLALAGKKASLTGVTQLSYARNIFNETNELDVSIMGAFASKVGAEQQTIGSQKILDFANFVYNFTVQPSNLSQNMTGIQTPAYTQGDYSWFKRGMLKATQDNNSASTGSFVGYGMFIDLKEGEDMVQTNFSDYIRCTKEETEDAEVQYVVDFTKLASYLKNIEDSCEHMELYVVDNILLSFRGLEELEALSPKLVVKNMAEARKLGV